MVVEAVFTTEVVEAFRHGNLMCGVVGVATAVMFGLSADVIQRAAGVVFRVVIVIAVDAEIVAIVDLYVSTMAKSSLNN